MPKSPEPQKQLILDALQKFPPGSIYLIAPKEFVARGYEYYRQDRVSSFGWSKDFSCLTARIKGTSVYAVNLLLKRDVLTFSCTCPAWSERTNCKHVVAALLTLKNLFQPEVFKRESEKPELREFLLAGISGLSPGARERERGIDKPKGYAVVIESAKGGLDFYVTKAGSRAPEYLFWGAPALRELWLPPYSSPYQHLPVLVRYLHRHENRYPIIVKIDAEETSVDFDPLLMYECKTELDVRADEVAISKVCRPEEEEKERTVILGALAFHPDTKRLGVIEDTEGWAQWNAYFRLASSDEAFDDEEDHLSLTFRMPLQTFQQYQLSYPAGQRDAVLDTLVLKKDGVETPLLNSRHTYCMTIIPLDKEAGLFSLRADCALGKDRLAPSESAFSFFERLRTGLPQYLSARKRQKALCRAFFEMTDAKTKTAVEKIIKIAVAEGDIDKFAMRREARAFLSHYHAQLATEDEQLHYHDNAWTTVAVDTRKELLLYKVPYELFGWDAISRMRAYDEMVVTADELYSRLSHLAERLNEHGIGLFLNNKPVKQARWEFEIDASRKADIDWFEVRPEIRCDGALIDALPLGSDFYQSGLLEDESCIRIIDSTTRELLDHFAAMQTGGKTRTDRGRELVRVPRLQMLDWISLRGKGVTIKLAPDDERLIERLLSFKRIEHRQLPVHLQAELRPYQQEGYDWLSFLYEHRFGACLADDMGLGKTVQAIALIAGIREGLARSPLANGQRPHLIVVPPSLLFNWEHELQKFYPALTITLYTGNMRSADFTGHDVVLTTYGIVRRDIDTLKDLPFHVVIFDEAQTVKNIHAGMTGAARQLQAHFKLTMTGTPLENHIGEYYSIIDLSLPGLLGEYDEFKALMKADTSPALNTVLRRTRPFVLRRTKANVLKDLPPKTETDVYLDLTEEQKALYTRTVKEVRSTIDNAYRDKTHSQANIIALTAILKLRQICVSPQLLAPELKGISPKVDFLVDNLRELMDENHCALVFSQFTSFLNIVEESLKESKIDFLRLDGSTPVVKRKKLVKDFQSGEGPSVFLLSLKAGGQGLNLTRASYVYHLDPWWNPAVEAQASDRAHRIGQINNVTVTRILMRHTIEEKMMELKQRKLALYQAIMDDSAEAGKGLSITRSDFEFLLG